VPEVEGPGDIINQDAAADANFVPQQPSVLEFAREGVVVGNVLTGVRLSGIDENPFGLGVSVGRVVKQRTLC
jgi:hypothetical protein